ncbi:MAG TPA: hypothetical protein VGC67_16520 [Cellulomonas sp.]
MTGSVPGPATFAGLTSPGARVAMVLVWCTGLVHTLLLWHAYPRPLLVAVGLAATLVGIAALTGPQEEMPLRYALVVAAVPVVNAAVLVPQLTEPTQNRVWLLEIGAYLTGLLAVRGRVAVATCGTGVLVLAVVAWALATGAGLRAAGSVLVLPASALVVGAIWYFVLRRTLEQVTAHRQAGAVAARARLAAEGATQDSRAELAVIAATVRPLLTEIADGRPAERADLDRYRVTEAAVRDRLRARSLTAAPLAAACTRARLRGVDVLLLDDGPAGAEALHEELLARLVALVDAVRTGRLTVRVMPAGRGGHTSVLTDDGRETVLRVLDAAGRSVDLGALHGG